MCIWRTKPSMTTYDTILDAAQRLTAQERVQLSFALTRDYDGRTFEALAEAWAEDTLGMTKAGRGEAGIDGVLPDGRGLQVKAKKAGAHSDSDTYVEISKRTLEQAADLLIVFIDYDTCLVTRTIGPVPISSLTHRGGRYFVSDMLRTTQI